MEDNKDPLLHLIDAIDSCQDRPDAREWLQRVCNPDFGLLESIIKAFMVDIEHKDFHLANNMLRTLRKVKLLIPQISLPQLLKNPEFPIAISQYILKTPVQNLVGDAFVLMVELFSITSFKPLMSEDFINALMRDLEVVSDEEIFQSIIQMFVSISHEQNVPYHQDIVIQTTLKHENFRYLVEIVAQLINKGDKHSIIQCLSFVRKIYNVPDVEFFFKNDFEVVVRVCFREILNAKDENDRYEYLVTLQCLSKHKSFLNERSKWQAFFEDLFYQFEGGIGEKCEKVFSQLKAEFV